MRNRIHTVLAAIGALALLGTLSGCIFVDRDGHGGRGGHCAAPPRGPMHYAYGGHR